MKRILLPILIVVLFTGCKPQNWNTFTLYSPDESLEVKIDLKNDKGEIAETGSIFYSILHKNDLISRDNQFNLEFMNLPNLGEDLKITDYEEKIVKEEWQRVWGRSKKVFNNYNEIRLKIEENGKPGRIIYLVFRAYNDGVAFRYSIPEQKNINSFQLTAENSTFNFENNHRIWAVDFGGYASHQESEFQEMYLSDVKSSIKGLPLLIKLSGSLWAAITEADLTDWAGMYLSSNTSADNSLITKLSPLPGEPEVLVKREAPADSPWRLMMIADSPGHFLESNILQNLNDPCAFEDVSWIKPGKSAWDWWWSNSYAPSADFELGSNTETMKYFIDFASEMGWKYQLVDWHWYGNPFVDGEDGSWDSNPDADITTMNPDINIPELVEYANSKNVKLLLWLEWNHAKRQMEEAFPLYEEWGIAGVKVDFMARDDQEMVTFYHRLVKKAAEHHLLVDFHGAYKPTGFSRTYPNLITREGVLGNEYTKWSDRITPEHTVTLAFTRNILGEMDFTPGAFVHVTEEEFKTEDLAPSPMVMGTRCNQLAMFVVYESALQVICDSPDNYRNSPSGLEFLERVPTTWDETRFINGQVGDYITIARKSDKEWYLGSMTDWDERTIEIPLDFLEEGKFRAEIWEDGENANENPEESRFRTMLVDKTTVIEAKLAKGGGVAMIISPEIPHIQ
ncbi:MAG: glycoside hydrolase family 97 protein [Bacteroidales bacterium]